MREENCQVVGNSGGAAVRVPTLTSAGKEFAMSRIGENEIGNKSGDGSFRRCCSLLYCDFSAAQQLLSPQCEPGLLAGAVV